MTAPLVGGCLWLLLQTMGTPWEVELDGKIVERHLRRLAALARQIRNPVLIRATIAGSSPSVSASGAAAASAASGASAASARVEASSGAGFETAAAAQRAISTRRSSTPGGPSAEGSSAIRSTRRSATS